MPDGELEEEGVIGARDDEFADGLALGAVGREEVRGGFLLEDESEFPGKVVRVLDAGVGAEAVLLNKGKDWLVGSWV